MSAAVVTTKNVRETEKELAHINVYIDDEYVGYICRNTNPFARVGENWDFSVRGAGTNKIYWDLYAATKKKLLTKIEESWNE